MYPTHVHKLVPPGRLIIHWSSSDGIDITCVNCLASVRPICQRWHQHTAETTTHQDVKLEHRCLGPSIRCSHFKASHCKEWFSTLRSRRDDAHVILKCVISVLRSLYSDTSTTSLCVETFLCVDYNDGVITVTSLAAILQRHQLLQPVASVVTPQL